MEYSDIPLFRKEIFETFRYKRNIPQNTRYLIFHFL